MDGIKNGNKKIIILSLVLLVAVFAALSACKGDKSDGGETVVVTDENLGCLYPPRGRRACHR